MGAADSGGDPLFGLTALGWWVQPCPQCSVSDARLKKGGLL